MKILVTTDHLDEGYIEKLKTTFPKTEIVKTLDIKDIMRDADVILAGMMSCYVSPLGQ